MTWPVDARHASDGDEFRSPTGARTKSTRRGRFEERSTTRAPVVEVPATGTAGHAPVRPMVPKIGLCNRNRHQSSPAGSSSSRLLRPRRCNGRNVREEALPATGWRFDPDAPHSLGRCMHRGRQPPTLSRSSLFRPEEKFVRLFAFLPPVVTHLPLRRRRLTGQSQLGMGKF